MANPILIETPGDKWTLVAENKMSGWISRVTEANSYSYFWTSRDYGEAGPVAKTDGLKALPLFENRARRAEINSDVGQDFYVWVEYIYPASDESPKVRVDL